MVTQELARPATREMPVALVIAAIPVAFAILGLALRYLAWTATGDHGGEGFAQTLCAFDCDWYVRIAEQGYDPWPVPHMGNWAFFPVDPVVVGIVRSMVALPTVELATAMSIVFSTIAVAISWPLFEGEWRAYVLFAAFVLAGPFSIYFTTFYSETAFLLLTVLVFVQLRRSRYVAAGLAAALLSATRIVGVFAVFAILTQAWVDHRRRGGRLLDFPAGVLARPEQVSAIFLAPLGLFAYMAFLWFHMGDGLAFQHVQRAWARLYGSPLHFLWEGLTTMPNDGWIASPAQLLAIAAIVGLLLVGVLFAWRRYAEAVFSAFCLVLPLFAGLASMLRFVAAQAPVTIALMRLLGRWPPVFALALAGLLLGDYFVTQSWIGGYVALI